MEAPGSEAPLLLMSDETRGLAVKRRRELLGIFSGYEFERASERVGIMVRRALLAKVEAGQASEASVIKVETVLDRLEEEIGEDAPTPTTGDSEGLVEFNLSGNFGVDVVVKGPVSDLPQLEQAVARLLREMRERES